MKHKVLIFNQPLTISDRDYLLDKGIKVPFDYVLNKNFYAYAPSLMNLEKGLKGLSFNVLAEIPESDVNKHLQCISIEEAPQLDDIVFYKQLGKVPFVLKEIKGTVCKIDFIYKTTQIVLNVPFDDIYKGTKDEIDDSLSFVIKERSNKTPEAKIYIDCEYVDSTISLFKLIIRIKTLYSNYEIILINPIQGQELAECIGLSWVICDIKILVNY